MEKITKEIIIEFFTANEVELISTHTKLCLPVINRIYRKMSAGIKFSGIKVDNNLICDGHHRYIAALLANFSLERIPGVTTSATSPVDWQSIVFEEDDWDTATRISLMNEQDAEFNNIAIEAIVELLK